MKAEAEITMNNNEYNVLIDLDYIDNKEELIECVCDELWRQYNISAYCSDFTISNLNDLLEEI